MALIKHNSETPRTFSNIIDKFFNDAISEGKYYKFLPDVDFIESEKHYELHAAVPGLNKEDFSIEVSNGLLTISGERKFVSEEKSKTYLSVETKYGSFGRSFQLPENADANKIEAEYLNGILRVIIPKDENKLLKTRVSVK